MCSQEGLPARFLLRADVNDDDEQLGQHGGARGGQWPRGCAAMATAATGRVGDDDGKARKGGNGSRVRLQARGGVLIPEIHLQGTADERHDGNRRRTPSAMATRGLG